MPPSPCPFCRLLQNPTFSKYKRGYYSRWQNFSIFRFLFSPAASPQASTRKRLPPARCIPIGFRSCREGCCSQLSLGDTLWMCALASCHNNVTLDSFFKLSRCSTSWWAPFCGSQFCQMSHTQISFVVHNRQALAMSQLYTGFECDVWTLVLILCNEKSGVHTIVMNWHSRTVS